MLFMTSVWLKREEPIGILDPIYLLIALQNILSMLNKHTRGEKIMINVLL